MAAEYASVSLTQALTTSWPACAHRVGAVVCARQVKSPLSHWNKHPDGKPRTCNGSPQGPLQIPDRESEDPNSTGQTPGQNTCFRAGPENYGRTGVPRHNSGSSDETGKSRASPCSTKTGTRASCVRVFVLAAIAVRGES